MESLKDKTYFEEQVQKIVDTREWTKKELANLGFEFPDSQTNFILASHPKCSAKELFEALKEADIYVRYFSGERIKNYLRITIGTQKEMEMLIQFIQNYISNRA